MIGNFHIYDVIFCFFYLLRNTDSKFSDVDLSAFQKKTKAKKAPAKSKKSKK